MLSRRTVNIAIWAAAGVALVVLLAAFPRTIGWMMLAAGGGALYCLPSIIAGVRSATNGTGIALVNVLLGWTGAGWIAALVWALVDKTPREKWEEERRKAALYAYYAQSPPPPQQ